MLIQQFWDQLEAMSVTQYLGLASQAKAFHSDIFIRASQVGDICMKKYDEPGAKTKFGKGNSLLKWLYNLRHAGGSYRYWLLHCCWTVSQLYSSVLVWFFCLKPFFSQQETNITLSHTASQSCLCPFETEELMLRFFGMRSNRIIHVIWDWFVCGFL